MAFPASPTNGQTYTTGGVTYVYDSTAGTWKIQTYSTLDANSALAQIKTVDGAGSGLDADTLDGITSSQFLRSDTSGTISGDLTITGRPVLGGQLYVSSVNSNTLNSGYAVNGSADIWINYRGYNDGQTQFRNFNIGDGKGTNIMWASGANRRVSINKDQTADYTLDVNGDIRSSGNMLIQGSKVDLPTGTSDPASPIAGTSYFNSTAKALKIYDGTNWGSVVFAPLGSVAGNPATSATAIISAGANTGSGYYYIKPHASSATYYVYCDMTTDGGGWMLMINARPGNGGQYYSNSDYGLSTINGVAGVPEYNKSTTSMFGPTKIGDFLKMTGFKYGRITPGPGVTLTSPYTGLYQRIGTPTTYSWMGTGFDCSNRATIASQNPWALTQYQNWSDCAAGTNGRVGGYTGASHYYPTTYDNGWQNFWKGDADGIRFSSTFSGENYSSIGQNTSPGYWWIKSDQ